MMRKIVVVCLVMLMVVGGMTGFTSGLINMGSASCETMYRSSSQSKSYTAHAPIHIDGNSQFTSANGVSSGSGTEDDPYLLENWDINANGANGIYIQNTDVYFIIRRCTIYNGKNNSNDLGGIYFYKVINGKIENCTIHNNHYGIYLYSSSNNNTITGNQIYNNWGGIWLYSSSNNNNIRANQIYNTYVDGIHLRSSSNNNITNNHIYNNSWHGIRVWGSSNNQISANQIHNSRLGIYLCSSSNNNDISANQIHSSSMGGIYLYYSSTNNNITDNHIHSNSDGIVLSYSSNNNITGNQVHNNSYGIRLEESSNNILRNNILENNTYNFGVQVQSWRISDYYQDIDTSNTINQKPIYYITGQNNLVFDNIEVGYLGLISCSNIVIKNLTLTNNNEGILLVDTTYSIITASQIHNNRYHGIYLYDSSNNTISANQIYNNHRGIEIRSSSNNNITGNQIHNNNEHGISLFFSSGNEVHYCDIYNNADYGIYNWKPARWDPKLDIVYQTNATHNWWGSADGPSGVGPGSGDAVSDNVLYDPWFTEPVNIFLVKPERGLDIIYLVIACAITGGIIVAFALLRLRRPEAPEVEKLEEKQKPKLGFPSKIQTMTLRCPGCRTTFSVEVKPKPFNVKCPHCGKEGVIK